MKIVIGSRKSALARIQAYRVKEALLDWAQKSQKSIEIDFLFKASMGDQNLDVSLKELPEKGAFTKDLQLDLQSGRCDCVVHSWKDLPIEMPEGHRLVATLERESAHDLLLVKREVLETCPETLHVLSSSPRRSYNLASLLPELLPWQVSDIHFEDIRGNIPTRVSKMLKHPQAHGLILAQAALDRLLRPLKEDDEEVLAFQTSLKRDFQKCEWMQLPLRDNPSAPAQGALAVEVLDKNAELVRVFEELASQFQDYFDCVQKERRVLQAYGGGCHQKIGAHVKRLRGEDFLFLRGEHESGEKLHFEGLFDHWESSSTQQGSLLNRSQVWPPSDEKRPSLFSREVVKLGEAQLAQVEQSDLFVARRSAVHTGLKWDSSKQRLWVSGAATWRAMASEGYWVSGSAESLGEDGLERSPWMAQNNTLLKLTHDGAPETGLPSVATYRLQASEEALAAQEFEGVEFCFWMSASQFFECLRQFPNLLERVPRHASGMGHSFDLIQPELNKAGKTLERYLNFEDCLRQVLDDDS